MVSTVYETEISGSAFGRAPIIPPATQATLDFIFRLKDSKQRSRAMNVHGCVIILLHINAHASKDNRVIFVPQVSSHHVQHSTECHHFRVTLVFLQHAQIFRLLLKISVEENI